MTPPTALTAALDRLVPGARLRVATLDSPAEMRLWLLDPEGMARPLSEGETDAIWETPPYWSFCWGAGRVLAAHLLAAPDQVRGRRVLDFGCGSGVVGIAAALAGASEVICCDADPLALEASAANARLNDVEVTLAADLHQVPPDLDLLCAADVLYDPANLTLPARFLGLARVALVADSRRPGLSLPGYQVEALGHGVTEPDLGEPDSVKRVRLFSGGGGARP